MNPERENIEAAIRRVQSGELSPAEATAMLLDEMQQREWNNASSSTDAEMLSQLVARLGPPPPDVLDRWCDCVECFTIAAHLAGQTFPPTDPDRWHLARNGDLLLPDHRVPKIDVESVDIHVREPARRHAALFRLAFAEQAKTELTEAESGIHSVLDRPNCAARLAKQVITDRKGVTDRKHSRSLASEDTDQRPVGHERRRDRRHPVEGVWGNLLANACHASGASAGGRRHHRPR